MTTPDTESRLAEVERRTRQQGDDITALYDLVQDVDRKVTVLDAKVDAGFAAVDSRLSALDAKVDQGFAAILAELRGQTS